MFYNQRHCTSLLGFSDFLKCIYSSRSQAIIHMCNLPPSTTSSDWNLECFYAVPLLCIESASFSESFPLSLPLEAQRTPVSLLQPVFFHAITYTNSTSRKEHLSIKEVWLKTQHISVDATWPHSGISHFNDTAYVQGSGRIWLPGQTNWTCCYSVERV